MSNITTTTKDLLVATSYRQILKMALPISLAMLVPQINFVTNNIFLSQLGETALGAAGITGVFYLVFALAGNGLNNGLQALMARRAGEQRPDEIGKLFGQAVWIALLFAAAGMFITYLFAATFLQQVLHSEMLKKEAIHFLQIRVLGLPFLFLFQLGNAFLVGSNNSRLLKYAFIVETIINILLDYLFIFGHYGFPALGFNGAAVASVIAEASAAIIIFSIIYYKKFHHRFGLFKFMRFNASLAGLIFKQSAPLVMQFLLSIIAWLLFYILIENTGERPLAISTTMRNVFGVLGAVTWAFASTSNAMVSNIIGQGLNDKVESLIIKIMRLSLLFTFFVCLLLNVFPTTFIHLFSESNVFAADAVPVIRTVSAGALLMAMATVWLNAVTATGNTRFNLLIELVAITLYTIYVVLVIAKWRLGLVWAWGSELLYWSSLLSLSYFYIRSGKWKGKKI
jgi:MATE family multidrug resistance protein